MARSMPASPTSPASLAFDAAHKAMVATWPVVPEDVWLDTPAGRTHLLVAGPKGAPPAFPVPGMATPGVMYTEQVAALVGEHRVYTVDIPGNIGFSVPVSRPKGFDYFVRWFGEVLAALKIERADYVGMSYGGHIGAQI